MRKLKQLLAAALVPISVLGTAAPAFAEDVTIPGNATEAIESQAVEVSYSLGSTFTVSIPKTIVLTGNGSTSYHVNVTGDIYADQTITVTPGDEVTLTDENGKGTVTASVAQDYTAFKYDLENATIKAVNKATEETTSGPVEGTITAEGLTAGKWKGTLNFKIGNTASLEAGLYDADGIMLCTWEESGIDVETNYTNKNTPASGYYVLTNNYPTATRVVIPDGVTNIGDHAFDTCRNLTSVTIPDSVTRIGFAAFWGTSLTSIAIPDGVTSIEDSAFGYCTNLTNITIPDGVTSIGENAFRRCTSLTSIIIPDGVTSIEDSAFENCTNLTSIIIPESVTSIGSRAFSDTPWLTTKQAENPLVIVNEILIDGQTTSGNVVIPEGVTSIGGWAFYKCKLTSITIPDSVISIGERAFYCSSLTSITIPEGVTSIEEGTFQCCKNLTSITIPEGVTSIGDWAFLACDNLTSVTFKNTSGWYIGSSAGEKTTALSSFSLSNKSTAATYLRDTYHDNYWTR